MDTNPMYNISLNHFKSLFPSAPTIGLGDDFFLIDVKFTERHNPLSHPCRFDGFMAIYCMGGHIKLNVNLQEYELKENMVFLYMPGNLIRINEFIESRQEDARYVCMAMSRDFVGSLMLDANKIFTKNLALIQHPCITPTREEHDILSGHVQLMIDVLKSESSYRVESLRTLASSMFYVLAGVWSSHIDADKAVPSRVRVVFEQFIKLVSEYHTQYRNVGFYADKLCLTPKYLSRIIKDATGRSAPDWIDAYVILEAKNLLKYSGDAIKEIVYKLNFPNQSVFYKFFKARTGMTPSEYRNS